MTSIVISLISLALSLIVAYLTYRNRKRDVPFDLIPKAYERYYRIYATGLGGAGRFWISLTTVTASACQGLASPVFPVGDLWRVLAEHPQKPFSNTGALLGRAHRGGASFM
jgi:hypothetical protein